MWAGTFHIVEIILFSTLMHTNYIQMYYFSLKCTSDISMPVIVVVGCMNMDGPKDLIVELIEKCYEFFARIFTFAF